MLPSEVSVAGLCVVFKSMLCANRDDIFCKEFFYTANNWRVSEARGERDLERNRRRQAQGKTHKWPTCF